MEVDGTELEYFKDDEVCLDFYLGEHSETKDQWAKRVWDKCIEYKSTLGLGKVGFGYDGEKMPSVYARDAKEIWEEKKRRRRAAFVKECTGKDCDPELLKTENIKKDVKEKKECNWPQSHSDSEIFKIRDEPLYNYKTATQRHREEQAKELANQKKEMDKRVSDIEKLRKKFDDETIAILYPQGISML